MTQQDKNKQSKETNRSVPSPQKKAGGTNGIPKNAGKDIGRVSRSPLGSERKQERDRSSETAIK